MGFTVEEYGDVVSRARRAAPGITAFELNLSCPNTSAGGIEFGADPAAFDALCLCAEPATRLPLIAKLSPVLPDIARMAMTARDAGADAISAVNTMPGLLFDGMAAGRVWERQRRRQRARAPSARRAWPWPASSSVSTVDPVIGVGGHSIGRRCPPVSEGGASLVAIGTGALADPRLPERIIRGSGAGRWLS